VTKRRALIAVGTALLLGFAALLSLLLPRETDVYAAALSQFPDTRPLLVSRPGTCSTGHSVQGVPAELVRQFQAANRPGTSALSLLPLRWSYDVGSLSRAYGRATIPRARTPVFLTRVGYNDDRTEAVFCAEARGGLMFYLRKDHGTWKVIRAESTWTSSIDIPRSGADV
jgi:hypothetical protein